nr:f-box/fbd/lrr-repeat protein [Quercus suber]
MFIYQKVKKSSDEDRISGLSDDILSEILSLLAIKEAVGTCIFSKRWRYVWTFMHRLEFDSFKDFPSMKSDSFTQMVSQVVTLHKGLNLHELRILFNSHQDNSFPHIHRWIAFAILCGTARIELNLSIFRLLSGFCGHPKVTYAIPPDFFDRKNKAVDDIDHYLKHLDSNSAILISRSGRHFGVDNFFSSVRDLSFTQVYLNDQDVENILSNCTSLERLHVETCSTLFSIKHVYHPLKLKCLELFKCWSMTTLEILAQNLVTFGYRGPKINIFLKGVRHLVDLTVTTPLICLDYPKGNSYVLDQFSCYFSQLKVLQMEVEAEKAYRNVPELSNLKLLMFYGEKCSKIENSTLIGITFVIMASPVLHRFELHLFRHKPCTGSGGKLISKGPHKYLKEVVLSGFKGLPIEIDFATYLLDNAIALEKMEIITSYIYLLGRRWCVAENNNEVHSRKQAQLFREGLASNNRSKIVVS